MRKFFWTFLALAWMPLQSEAQVVQGSAKYTWTLPTTGCTEHVTPCDNKPLTGPFALTGVAVYIATSPIPDNFNLDPTVVLNANATTHTYTTTVPNGSTIYARFRAINSKGMGPFSQQVSKVIELGVIPGPITDVTVTFTITTTPPEGD